jgi:hypothetical protein
MILWSRTPIILAILSFFLSLSLDDGLEGFRGLAGSWNRVPSRSLSGLHYVFKGFDYQDDEGSVRVSGPVIEITQGESGGTKIFPEGYFAEMDQEDFEEEQHLAQSIYQARSGPGTSVGTAFLVGRDLVLTNRHIMGISSKTHKWECGQFSIVLNHKDERVDCRKVRFCSSKYDFCVVEMKTMENGLSLGAEMRPLRLAKRVAAGTRIPLLHIGNAAGLGLQASRAQGLRLSQGEFHHFVPTLNGSSGAPIFDNKNQVVGINWAHTGKDFVSEDSFNRGILSSTIYEELKKTHPYTLKEIKSFRTWLRREQNHRSVRIEEKE